MGFVVLFCNTHESGQDEVVIDIVEGVRSAKEAKKKRGLKPSEILAAFRLENGGYKSESLVEELFNPRFPDEHGEVSGLIGYWMTQIFHKAKNFPRQWKPGDPRTPRRKQRRRH